MNVHIEEVKVFLMSSPYRNRGLYCSEGFKPFRFKVDRKDLETRKTFNSFMLPTVNFSLEAETNSFVFYKRAHKKNLHLHILNRTCIFHAATLQIKTRKTMCSNSNDSKCRFNFQIIRYA